MPISIWYSWYLSTHKAYLRLSFQADRQVRPKASANKAAAWGADPFFLKKTYSINKTSDINEWMNNSRQDDSDFMINIPAYNCCVCQRGGGRGAPNQILLRAPKRLGPALQIGHVRLCSRQPNELDLGVKCTGSGSLMWKHHPSGGNRVQDKLLSVQKAMMPIL